jgi:L-iditol 2-dehydrogenase
VKAAALHGPRDLRIIEVPELPLADDEVRVAVLDVGLCGSDVHFFEHGRVGAFDLGAPQVIGHEAAGFVVEVGAAVERVAVGDRVAIEPGRACGGCRECTMGWYNLCPDIAFMGMPPTAGCLAENVVVAARFAHPIPDALSAEQAALLEPLSVALWAVSRADVGIGHRVLVAGAGPIGVLVARVAAAAGAAEIVVTDVVPERLAGAPLAPRTRTADVSAGWQSLDEEFDVFLECAGATRALLEGSLHLRRRGRAVLVGVPREPEVPVHSIVTRWRELSITTVHRYAHTWPRAMALVVSGEVRVDDLVGRRFQLGDTALALEEALAGRVGRKAMIEVALPPDGPTSAIN